jgi:PhnB protein
LLGARTERAISHFPAPKEVSAMANPIPDGYPRVNPYLIVDGAAAAIDFYTSVLGATERMRMEGPDGKVGHAELEIGDSVIMLADEHPEIDALGPRTVGGTPVSLHVYVEDVDGVFERAIGAGAKALRPVEDKFYGDRSGGFEDPFGHRWDVSTHVEDIPPEEMSKRAAEAAESG